MAEKSKDPGFEHSLKRLEELVAEMERGELSLDKMISSFEEGSKLVKVCTEKLDDVEQKIEKLVKKEDGIGTEPLGDHGDGSS
jgi:exodeoxyribonuclease VII small subunit